MRAKALTAALLVSATCGGAAWAEDASVTLQDRKALSLTVYNGGTGLVRDTRTVAVPAGRTAEPLSDYLMFALARQSASFGVALRTHCGPQARLQGDEHDERINAPLAN